MNKKALPIVHCTYGITDKSASEILEASFRLYLARMLAPMGQPAGQDAQ